MADISMCEGIGCDLKSVCYRYRATPSKRVQSYFAPPLEKDGTCEYYIEFKDN